MIKFILLICSLACCLFSIFFIDWKYIKFRTCVKKEKLSAKDARTIVEYSQNKFKDFEKDVYHEIRYAALNGYSTVKIKSVRKNGLNYKDEIIKSLEKSGFKVSVMQSANIPGPKIEDTYTISW